jgi:hypothetical protein
VDRTLQQNLYVFITEKQKTENDTQLVQDDDTGQKSSGRKTPQLESMSVLITPGHKEYYVISDLPSHFGVTESANFYLLFRTIVSLFYAYVCSGHHNINCHVHGGRSKTEPVCI